MQLARRRPDGRLPIPVFFRVALGVLALVASCRSPGGGKRPPDPRETYLRALEAFDAGDFNRALGLLDPLIPTLSELPKARRGKIRLLFGEANLRLALRAIRNRGSGSMIRACLLDAELSLRKATSDLEGDPDPWRLLGDTLVQREAPGEAAKAYDEALRRLAPEARDGEEGRILTLRRIDALYRRFVELRRSERGDPGPKTRNLADRILDLCEPAFDWPSSWLPAYRTSVWVLQWMDQTEAAFELCEKGLLAHPGDSGMHEFMTDLAHRTGNLVRLERTLARLSGEIREPRTRALCEFYLGNTLVLEGDAKRGEGDAKSARDFYERAAASFKKAAELEPGFARNSGLRLALCRVSQAWIALDEGNEKAAEKALDRAWNASPAIAAVTAEGYDRWFDGFRKSYRMAAYALGGRFLGGGNRLPQAVRYWRKITRRHPDWGQAWNNLGLACRDRGVQLAKAGSRRAAKDLWEESYAAYEKAVELQPRDPRIVNDCGLMLLYHLGRDLEKAEILFRRAINLGTASLGELPPKEEDEDEGTRNQRVFLEEAVGDAWQNLGVLALRRKRSGEALRFFREAVKYFPYERREASRRIEALERSGVRVPPERKVPSGKESVLLSSGGDGLLPLPSLVGPGLPEFQEDPIEASRKDLAAGRALALLDRIEPRLGQNPENPELLYLAGRGSLLFAILSMREGRKGVRENLIDAEDRFRKADRAGRTKESPHFREAMHVLPMLFLCRTLLLEGKTSEAWDEGRRHLTHLDSIGVRPPVELTALLLAATARAGCRNLIAKYEKKRPPDSKTLDEVRAFCTRARKALEGAAKGAPIPPPHWRERLDEEVDLLPFFRDWKNLELWAGRDKAAVRVLASGASLLGGAASDTLLGETSGLVARRGGAATALEILAAHFARNADRPLTIWYEAYLKVILGNELRIGGGKEKPSALYAQARKGFTKAMERESSYTGNSRYWIAMTRTAEGWMRFGEGDGEGAASAWIEALKTDRRAAEAKDPVTGKTAKEGLLTLGGPFFQKGRFAEGAKLFARVREVLPGDADILNNLGLFYREWGTRAPKTERAAIFEKSWEAYQEALAVDPGNIRLINDTALIDVYYLHRRPKEAEALLREAAMRGKAMLKRGKPPSWKGSRRDLEEAVGDALMNLGVLLRRSKGRLEEAAALFEESLRYHPGKRRASVRFLREIDAERRAKKNEPTKDAPSGKGGGTRGPGGGR